MTSSASTALPLRDGTRLVWESAGEGPVVLLVHGIGSSRRKWEPQVAPLVALGYRVLRFDLRGFGDSTTPAAPHEMRHFSGDLAALVEALDLGRFHLVGHSLGGMIAQQFALDHPGRVRTLALASTTS
ncbi:MAG TPA: alpha/beta hydrolase, partial [Polyangiaceae bacterium]|nr:alpha/beta hydrolase [Polyangiaceae bacterium]